MELCKLTSKSMGSFSFLTDKTLDPDIESNDTSSLLEAHSVSSLVHTLSAKSLQKVPSEFMSTEVRFNINSNTNTQPPEEAIPGTSKSFAKPTIKNAYILSEFPKPTPPPKVSTFHSFKQLLWKSFQTLTSFLLSLMTFPLIFIGIILPTMILRLLISVSIYCISGGKIQVLSYINSFRASGSEFYTVVQVIRGECNNLDKIMHKVEKAVYKKGPSNKLKYPNLQKRLVKKLGLFCFMDHREDFSIRNHVRYFEDLGYSDEKGMDQNRLIQMLQNDFQYGFSDGVDIDYCSMGSYDSESSASTGGGGGGRYDMDYFEGTPQWEVLVVPKFYYKRREDRYLDERDDKKFYAVIFRANNTILDKKTVLKIFQDEIVENYDFEQGENPQGLRMEENFGFWGKVCILFCKVFLGPWFIFKDLLNRSPKPLGDFRKKDENAEGRIPRYLLNSAIAINRPIIGAIKNLTQTSVTSILVSCARGAGRNMILGYNMELPKKYWVSLRGFLEREKGVESIYNFELKEDKYSFPLERLYQTYQALGKGFNEIVMEAWKETYLKLFWIAGAFPICICNRIYKLVNQSNFTVEVWPLGDEPLRVFGNDLVADVFAWVSISGTNADFGVTFTTYAGRLRANFISDNEALGYNTRRMGLCDEFMEEYIQLTQICNLKPDRLIRPGPLGYDELGRLPFPID